MATLLTGEVVCAPPRIGMRLRSGRTLERLREAPTVDSDSDDDDGCCASGASAEVTWAPRVARRGVPAGGAGAPSPTRPARRDARSPKDDSRSPIKKTVVAGKSSTVELSFDVPAPLPLMRSGCTDMLGGVSIGE